MLSRQSKSEDLVIVMHRGNFNCPESEQPSRQGARKSCNRSGNNPPSPDQRSSDAHDFRYVTLFLKQFEQKKITGLSGAMPTIDEIQK